MVQVIDATTPTHLDEARSLMRSFVGWHRVRHAAHLDLIDAYFDPIAYEDELQALPGKYQPPTGALLLATVDGKAAGCVAMRPIDEGCCEMKRMFVYPEFHGKGVGKALAEKVVQRGRAAGFRAMRLDTGILQIEAIGLYQKLGFQKVDPYYEAPKEMESFLVFMELQFGQPLVDTTD
jgi:putative acetyltransferase